MRGAIFLASIQNYKPSQISAERDVADKLLFDWLDHDMDNHASGSPEGECHSIG